MACRRRPPRRRRGSGRSPSRRRRRLRAGRRPQLGLRLRLGLRSGRVALLGLLHVDHLELRERVPDRPCLLLRAHRQQRPYGLEAELGLVDVLLLLGGQPAPAQIDQGDDRLEQHVLDPQLLERLAELLLRRLSRWLVQVRTSSAAYVLRLSATSAAKTSSNEAPPFSIARCRCAPFGPGSTGSM